MRPLEGKAILFIAPTFFGYEKEIKRRLEAWGASVDFYENRPSTGFVVKALIRVHKDLVRPLVREHVRRIVSENRTKSYDHILVIKGEAFGAADIARLRQAFPRARAVLYLWDALRNNKHARQNITLFDRAFTFDQEDAAQVPALTFRPLFFVDSYRELGRRDAAARRIDLLFVGTVHGDRYNIVNRIKRVLPAGRTFVIRMFIQARPLFWLRKLVSPRFLLARKREFVFEPVPKEEVMALIEDSKALLDIEHPGQKGLTMRAIEALGARRKIVTTNAAIRQYDFYNPNNIHVLSRNDPVIEEEFWELPYVDVPDATYDRYSLDSWLEELFGLARTGRAAG